MKAKSEIEIFQDYIKVRKLQDLSREEKLEMKRTTDFAFYSFGVRCKEFALLIRKDLGL